MRVRVLLALIIGWIVGCAPAAALSIKPDQRNDPSRHRHFALLFIHGLGGDPVTTFSDWQNVISQDKEMLIDEETGGNINVSFSDFDIFSVYYETKVTQLSIVEIGRNLADQIEETNSVFRHYDMVFVVAHSLGGLVLHEAFRTLVGRNHSVWFRFLPAVLELGVPVNGSLFADAAQQFPDAITKYLGYNPNLVIELQTHSDYLDSLNKFWADMIAYRTQTDGWPLVYCGYETRSQLSGVQLEVAKALGLKDGKVVPAIYSSNACNTGASNSVEATHTDLPKVKSEDNDAHKLLRRMIEETLRRLKTRRYVRDSSKDLHETFSHIAEASTSRYAEDRATGVRLYKERIVFNDLEGATKSVPVDGQVAGWSIDDAVRRLAGRYNCLSVSGDRDVLSVSVIAGVHCAN